MQLTKCLAVVSFSWVFALGACSSDDDESPGTGGTGATGGGGSGGSQNQDGGGGTSGSSGSAGSAGSASGGSAGSSGSSGASGSGGSAGSSSQGTADAWITNELSGAELHTGNFDTRTTVETPALIKDATACCAKYSFDIAETVDPDDRRVGLVNVTIKDLVSSDAFGGGIQTSKAAGVVVFMDNVEVEPNWPNWVDYQTTNKDGLVLDGSAAIYAEDLTIKNWNADGAIDNKAPISQFVRLRLEGKGHRGIRYWGPGPHYLVESTLENQGGLGEGSLLWFGDCDTAVVNIYASTFNGQATVPSNLVSCDNGSAPTLNYLTTDPRTTGEMHEMFTP